jgi:aminoglycoside 3-N-acetyltransferase
MISFRELVTGLRMLGIESYTPLLVHAQDDWLAQVRGGTDTVLTALLSNFDSLMVPAFTSSTLVTPLEGPSDNALDYGEAVTLTQDAEIFSDSLLPDPNMGQLAGHFVHLKNAQRSQHPLISFVGVGVGSALQAQTLTEPYGTIRVLTELNGWVLFMGSNQESNFSLHYAEHLAGRKQFVRWALTVEGIAECINMPGCSRGFEAVDVLFKDICRLSRVGNHALQAYPITPMLQIVRDLIGTLPEALLCGDSSCAYCRAVRNSISDGSVGG